MIVEFSERTKDLSEKLYNWTKNRWLISFSKEQGGMSEKEKKNSLKKKDIKDYESSNEFKNLLNAFPDIELINIEKNDRSPVSITIMFEPKLICFS